MRLLTIEGNAHHIIDPLLPTYFEIKPNRIVPGIAANDGIHPIQTASSKVIGPELRGESLDCRRGSNEDVQPIEKPFSIIQILAKLWS